MADFDLDGFLAAHGLTEFAPRGLRTELGLATVKDHPHTRGACIRVEEVFGVESRTYTCADADCDAEMT